MRKIILALMRKTLAVPKYSCNQVVTTIKTKGRTFTSSYEEEAAVMESALSWTLTNTNHHSIPYSVAQTVSPCVKPSSHSILEHSPSTTPSTSFRVTSSSNWSLTILLFQVTISPTKQPKKPPPSPQTQCLLFLYLVLCKSLVRRFVTLH